MGDLGSCGSTWGGVGHPWDCGTSRGLWGCVKSQRAVGNLWGPWGCGTPRGLGHPGDWDIQGTAGHPEDWRDTPGTGGHPGDCPHTGAALTGRQGHEGLQRAPAHHADHHGREDGDGVASHVHDEQVHGDLLQWRQSHVPAALQRQGARAGMRTWHLAEPRGGTTCHACPGLGGTRTAGAGEGPRGKDHPHWEPRCGEPTGQPPTGDLGQGPAPCSCLGCRAPAYLGQGHPLGPGGTWARGYQRAGPECGVPAPGTTPVGNDHSCRGVRTV